MFYTITLLFISIAIFAFLLKWIKQPTFLAYIITGLILGPSFLNVVHQNTMLETFSELGIVLLLFLVGLGLTPTNLKEMFKSSLLLGILQIAVTYAVAYLFLIPFHLSTTENIYIAIGLSFSSTIVVIKLLSDKNSLETWHGKLSTGILLTQDFVAMFIFMIISLQAQGQSLTTLLVNVFVKGVVSISLLFILSYFLLKKLGDSLAKSTELLFIFSLAWAFGFAALFQYLGFSLEFGALISGVIVSISPYRVEISSRLKPLRDFFIILFFLSLGLQINTHLISKYLGAITTLTLFALIIKPLIVSIILRISGFAKRTSVFTGIDLSQISAFSILIITFGIKSGILNANALVIMTSVMVLSVTISTYLINYEEKLYNYISPLLPFLDSNKEEMREIEKYNKNNYDIILFGYNRTGYELVETAKKLRKKILIIDFNPETIKKVRNMNIDCVFGDANDIELLDKINFKKVKIVVSTIPDLDANILLIHKAKEKNRNAVIIVIAYQIDDALKLYDEGATYVIMPHFIGGHHISTLIQESEVNSVAFIREHIRHKKELLKRKKAGEERLHFYEHVQ